MSAAPSNDAADYAQTLKCDHDNRQLALQWAIQTVGVCGDARMVTDAATQYLDWLFDPQN